MKKIIETQRAPGAIGPYVQGVDLGSMVFTSGQIPVCPQTGEIPADVQDQARLSLENVKAIVVAAGMGPGAALVSLSCRDRDNGRMGISPVA